MSDGCSTVSYVGRMGLDLLTMLQGVSKKGPFRIPALMEALGCSKGLDIKHLFETELCDSRLCGYFRLGSCGVHLPSQ